MVASSWKPCAQPRFDDFASCIVGPWTATATTTTTTATTESIREVEEVMRSCGGAIQGIREIPLDKKASEEERRTYHNHADGGFVYDDDGSYTAGPEQWDWSVSDDEECSIWHTPVDVACGGGRRRRKRRREGPGGGEEEEEEEEEVEGGAVDVEEEDDDEAHGRRGGGAELLSRLLEAARLARRGAVRARHGAVIYVPSSGGQNEAEDGGGGDGSPSFSSTSVVIGRGWNHDYILDSSESGGRRRKNKIVLHSEAHAVVDAICNHGEDEWISVSRGRVTMTGMEQTHRNLTGLFQTCMRWSTAGAAPSTKTTRTTRTTMMTDATSASSMAAIYRPPPLRHNGSVESGRQTGYAQVGYGGGNNVRRGTDYVQSQQQQLGGPPPTGLPRHEYQFRSVDCPSTSSHRQEGAVVGVAVKEVEATLGREDKDVGGPCEGGLESDDAGDVAVKASKSIETTASASKDDTTKSSEPASSCIKQEHYYNQCVPAEEEGNVFRQIIANTNALDLSRPFSDRGSGDPGTGTIEWESSQLSVDLRSIKRARMPNPSQAWPLVRAKWEKQMNAGSGDDADATVVKSSKIGTLVGWSFIETIPPENLDHGDAIATGGAINLHMLSVCPVTKVTRSEIRCHDANGSLISVAFFHGSLSN
ncbi:hypothetical protein ACHAW5_009908 [Stephanodiscus triporus]|uniref:Uncharacterized protein n=1 Tax=Stephanodiscus triporus TaxID=2934178 RepID=A0ABD3Q1P7_9STRA